jgi:hypothetical protein
MRQSFLFHKLQVWHLAKELVKEIATELCFIFENDFQRAFRSIKAIAEKLSAFRGSQLSPLNSHLSSKV